MPTAIGRSIRANSAAISPSKAQASCSQVERDYIDPLAARYNGDPETDCEPPDEHYPHNGWSMFGLAQRVEAQQRTEEAEAVREIFEHAWSRADVELTASRM